jgi:hypothetical protein
LRKKGNFKNTESSPAVGQEVKHKIIKTKTMKLLFTILTILFTLHNLQAQNSDYGSLAIDAINGKQYGWAINYDTQAEANQKALSECQKNGGNQCHTVLWFKGGCAAYVVEPGNSSLYGWGAADTQAEAERIAKQEARSRGASDLVVRVWGCNGNKLQSSEAELPSVQGTYVLHFSKAESDKKIFISNIFFLPNVVTRTGTTWSWTSDASQILTPKATDFYDQIEEDLYGYLTKEQRKKVLTRNTNVDWEGASEFKYLKSSLDMTDMQARKEKMNSLREQLVEAGRKDGLTVVTINL